MGLLLNVKPRSFRYVLQQIFFENYPSIQLCSFLMIKILRIEKRSPNKKTIIITEFNFAF